jgi:hypothetical protein
VFKSFRDISTIGIAIGNPTFFSPVNIDYESIIITISKNKKFELGLAGTTPSSKKRRFYGVCTILLFVVDVLVDVVLSPTKA